jgi:hypothetical protein
MKTFLINFKCTVSIDEIVKENINANFVFKSENENISVEDFTLYYNEKCKEKISNVVFNSITEIVEIQPLPPEII